MPIFAILGYVMSKPANKTKERFKVVPAVYLVQRRGEGVLLLRRANTGYQDGKYSLIAGHLDGDELGTVAIAREAKEEAGIDVDPSDLKFIHLVHRLNRNGDHERVDFFYEGRKWQGEVTNTEPEKCDDLSWHPINKLPDNMLPLIRLVLNDVSNGISYSEYEEEPV